MPLNYYSDMVGMSVDAELFKVLVRERFPSLMRKLTYFDVEISCASWQWFVTLFSYNLEHVVGWLTCRIYSVSGT